MKYIIIGLGNYGHVLAEELSALGHEVIGADVSAKDRRKALIRFANSLKSMSSQQQNIFEGMNILYFGPINGHDVKNICLLYTSQPLPPTSRKQ